MNSTKDGNQLNIPVAIVTIHDACPAFSSKIFKLIEEVESFGINYNIAVVPFFNEKQDLPRFPDFVGRIKSCHQCEIALYGLYYDDRNGNFDDFHTVTKAAAEEEIRAGLEIFEEIDIKPDVFIPPAWKLNDNSIKVLEKLGFILTEMQEEFILLGNNSFKKKVPKVLNWDSTGYTDKNIVNIGKDERHFKLLMKVKPQIIRIALHPRDPYKALKDQKEIICKLKDQGYGMLTYSEVIPKLQRLLLSI